jgi:hypothetical protein
VLPNVETGADGLGVGMAGGGLRPPTPSPVEPIGIPPRPVGDVDPIPVGDEADEAGPPAGPAAMPAHVPEAVPARLPPSKSEPDAGLEAPVLDPPLKLPAVELMPAQVAVLLVVGGLTGDVPEVVGLTPTDPNSVVPSGIPVGGTGAAGPVPRGMSCRAAKSSRAARARFRRLGPLQTRRLRGTPPLRPSGRVSCQSP